MPGKKYPTPPGKTYPVSRVWLSPNPQTQCCTVSLSST